MIRVGLGALSGVDPAAESVPGSVGFRHGEVVDVQGFGSGDKLHA